MACTEAVSVVLSWLRAAFGGRNQCTLATSQRTQLTSATQRPGPIVATEVPEYTSPPTMEVPDKEYDREKTSVMQELEINDSHQEDPSGDGQARPSTASSVIDLNGLPDERPWQPRDSFQNWVASTVNIAHPTYREKSQQANH
ncbi:uncharacterized protein NFIA_062210 [Aspergillus fischeri NRRL 181]|uniref:Uncharacterized protein n=1 Tax=Neosartorya fischeri (strain ATCC 1020 / DSM 3700 / CBS 544.65 / FGSC A1164 / JCM 1740 / NRRL 181 / WB 181) TaxID=331117 RepID=A1D5R6_NEOFI|nr:uncharacterized protein NFIA_062210 [Aspergillus fischeri NRRL 181]EAW21060.1 hypothetical protein NFIA_062210 [Aspergillus fischeri NRRL 181]